MTSTNLPSITIVTPSYNQAEYIEETIDSVLSQNYPALEFIIFDGGSTDGSVDIIRKYEKHLTHWVTEKDRGQSDAINKGFRRAAGEIFNWLCSDDTLEPDALKIVGETFAGSARPDVVVGGCRRDVDGKKYVVIPNSVALNELPYANGIPQSSCFYRRSLVTGDSLVREDLHFVMDIELWCRLLGRTSNWAFIHDTLSFARTTESNKTSVGALKIVREHDRLCRELDRRMIPLTMAYANTRLRLDLARHRFRNRLFWSATAPMWHAMNFCLSKCYGQKQVRDLDDSWFTFLWPQFSKEVANAKPAAN